MGILVSALRKCNGVIGISLFFHQKKKQSLQKDRFLVATLRKPKVVYLAMIIVIMVVLVVPFGRDKIIAAKYVFSNECNYVFPLFLNISLKG